MAVVGVAAAVGVGAVASSVVSAGAASDAANTQANAALQGQQLTQYMYDQTRSDLLPYQQVGLAALPQYQNLLGASPGGMQTALETLKGTPGYQFALQQGLQATQSGFAAQGLAKSGAALKGAANYSEGLAETTYQNILNNFYGAVQTGQNAAAQTGAFAMQSAQQQSALLTNAGAAKAAGIVGSANAINSGISSITNALTVPALYSASGNSGGLYGTAQPAYSTSGWLP